MTGDGAEPGEIAALRERVAKLESDLRQTQTVVSECVLTTATAALVAQTLGRKHTELFRRNALLPNNGPSLLDHLDERLQALVRRFEETARGG
jgi:hypothetical protein